MVSRDRRGGATLDGGADNACEPAAIEVGALEDLGKQAKELVNARPRRSLAEDSWAAGGQACGGRRIEASSWREFPSGTDALDDVKVSLMALRTEWQGLDAGLPRGGIGW